MRSIDSARVIVFLAFDEVYMSKLAVGDLSSHDKEVSYNILPVLLFDVDSARSLCLAGGGNLSTAVKRLPDNFDCTTVQSSHFFEDIGCDSLLAVVYLKRTNANVRKIVVYPNSIQFADANSKLGKPPEKRMLKYILKAREKGFEPFLLKGIVTAADFYICHEDRCFGFSLKERNLSSLESLYRAQYGCGNSMK